MNFGTQHMGRGAETDTQGDFVFVSFGVLFYMNENRETATVAS